MAWRWCGVRRVFLCMFMFQYSLGNTVNNATGFYSLRLSLLLYVSMCDVRHVERTFFFLSWCGLLSPNICVVFLE